MSSEARTVRWSISKAQGSLSVDKSSILLEEDGATDVITVTRLGDGRITATTSDSSICTVSVNETTGEVTVTAVDDGIATVTINCAEGSNYTAPASVEVNVTCEIALEDLDSLSWAEIVQIIQSGRAAEKFAVGATKTITFPSQINLELNNSIAANSSWKAYILGIDHNSNIEGTNRVHFCIGKNATGEEISFLGKDYNTAETSSGGWKSSNIKTWLNGTFYNALPSDLKAVITECTKYTDNTGNSNIAANVTATNQKIWLMAEFEVSGSRKYANQYEQNKQAQYDYYKNGNSVLRYGHWSKPYGTHWFLRSPSGGGGICGVYGTGFNVGNASSAPDGAGGGIVPCFTIS